MNDSDKDAVNEKLLKRIRNLYAMSKEHESSPHEAITALRRCQSLMSKFGITEKDLETSEFSVAEGYQFKKQLPRYVSVLASAVGKLHDCLVVRDNSNGRVEFRGYTVDSEIAPMTLEYLLAVMDRNLRSAKKIGAVSTGRSASQDYRVGFAIEVFQRCTQIDDARRATELEDAGDGASLVVRKMALVNEHYALAGVRRASKVKWRASSDTAAGREDGSKVSLNQQVVDSSGKKLLAN